MPLALIPRALQSLTSMSSSTGLPTATSSATGTVPSPRASLLPTSSSNSNRSDLIKSVLQWLLLTAAFIIIGIILMRRVQHFRRTRRSFSTFFTSRTSSQTSTHSRLYPRTTSLHVPSGTTPTLPPPIALLSSHRHQHPRRHTTMAMDIDAGGRRLGARGLQSDHDGVLDDKDVLPAYDVSGGPPKYIELDVLGERTESHRDAGVELESTGALGREGAEAATQSQAHQLPDEATSSSTSYSSAPPGDPAPQSVDDVQDHPPTSSVHPDSETRRID